MQRIGLGQPDVTVDSCTLVEPAFSQRGIDADRKGIPATVVEKVSEGRSGTACSRIRCVPTKVPLQKMSALRKAPSNSMQMRRPSSLTETSKVRRYHPTLVSG